MHKRVTDPARCGRQRGVGRERREVGVFQQGGERLKREKGEATRTKNAPKSQKGARMKRKKGEE